MKPAVIEGTKLTADTLAGVTIADATDSNGLIVTLVTIVGRLLIELIINRRLKKKTP
jgi:hypothetical protein